MSEKEKKAIEILKSAIKDLEESEINAYYESDKKLYAEYSTSYKTILNLIKNQQKQIEGLKRDKEVKNMKFSEEEKTFIDEKFGDIQKNLIKLSINEHDKHVIAHKLVWLIYDNYKCKIQNLNINNNELNIEIKFRDKLIINILFSYEDLICLKESSIISIIDKEIEDNINRKYDSKDKIEMCEYKIKMCDYCEDERSILYDDDYQSLNIFIKNGHLWEKTLDMGTDINYCPMCGRKLGE